MVNSTIGDAYCSSDEKLFGVPTNYQQEFLLRWHKSCGKASVILYDHVEESRPDRDWFLIKPYSEFKPISKDAIIEILNELSEKNIIVIYDSPNVEYKINLCSDDRFSVRSIVSKYHRTYTIQRRIYELLESGEFEKFDFN